MRILAILRKLVTNGAAMAKPNLPPTPPAPTGEVGSYPTQFNPHAQNMAQSSMAAQQQWALQNQMAGVQQAGQWTSGIAVGTAHPHQHLYDRVSKLQAEIASFEATRRQDAALRNTYYKTLVWLKDAHPEVLEEYHAMIALLKASGETL
jgi:hypothetical protein